MADGDNTARAAGRVIGKMAAQKASRSRYFRATIEGMKAVGKSFARTLTILFHQVTGFFFLCFAALGAVNGWREYHTLNGAPWNGRMWAAVLFTTLFSWFALGAFIKAGKKR